MFSTTMTDLGFAIVPPVFHNNFGYAVVLTKHFSACIFCVIVIVKEYNEHIQWFFEFQPILFDVFITSSACDLRS